MQVQFTLRTMLAISILIGLAVGWRMNWWRANIGIELKVHQPLAVKGSEVPEFITEFSWGRKVREHDRNHQFAPAPEKRMHDLRNDLSKFRRQFTELDVSLLKSNNSELLELARQALNDDSADLMSVANAAWILDQAGDKNAYPIALNRMKERRKQDQGKRWELFDVFPTKKLVTDPEIVDELKSRVGEDSSFGRRSQWVLFKTGIDPQPLVNRYLQAAEQETKKPTSISWLIKHAPSARALELAENYLFQPPAGMRWNSDYLARTILIKDFSHSTELQAAADRIERRLVEFIRTLRKNDPPNGGHRSWTFWRHLANCGSNISKELFIETLEDPQLVHRRSEAVNALIRLGHQDECAEYLRSAVADMLEKKIWQQSTLLRQHEKCCGQEESIQICLNLANQKGNLPAIRNLAEIFKGTGDPKISQLVLDKMFLDGQGKFAVEALELLEKIGHSKLQELWGKLPTSTTADPIVGFYQHWHTQGIVRNDLVRWINETLQPDKPLTVHSVVEESKFLAKPEHYLWRFVNAGFKSRHQFAVAALAHSGNGDLAFGEDIPLADAAWWISKLATTQSTEFQVTSHSTELQNALRTFRMVVNNRLYQFVLNQPTEYWQDNYDVRAVVELLNTIAIRQRTKRRFFAYPTEWDVGFCLVMFIEPETAMELDRKFGLSPVEGCNYYLDH